MNSFIDSNKLKLQGKLNGAKCLHGSCIIKMGQGLHCNGDFIPHILFFTKLTVDFIQLLISDPR